MQQQGKDNPDGRSPDDADDEVVHLDSAFPGAQTPSFEYKVKNHRHRNEEHDEDQDDEDIVGETAR